MMRCTYLSAELASQRATRPLAGLLAAALLLIPATASASLLVDFGDGQATLTAKVRTGYRGAKSGFGDFGAASDSFRAKFKDAPVAYAAAWHVQQPHRSKSKGDLARAASEVGLAFGDPGDPGELDTIDFHLDALAGAYDAMNKAGLPADALVRARGVFRFSTDPVNGADDVLMGYMKLGKLRRLHKYEDFLRVDIRRDGKLVDSIEAGEKGRNLRVFSGSDYMVQMVYGTTIPKGEGWCLCPQQLKYAKPYPFFANERMTLRAVPEPATLALGLAALPILLLRRRRPASAR